MQLKHLILFSKKAIFFSCLFTCSVYACEINPENESDKFYKCNPLLSPKCIDFFCAKGKSLLTALSAGRPINTLTGTLYSEVQEYLPNTAEGQNSLKYSKTAEYALLTNSVCYAFSSGDQQYIKERKNRLSAIICIAWALKKQAYEQKEFFESGSFTVIDPNQKFSTFLLDYVKLVTGSQNPKDLSHKTTLSNFAYPRDPAQGYSSHHKSRSPESQFGIDVRFEVYDTLSKLLPFQKAHLLFGTIHIGNETPLFLKLEEVGLGSKGEKIAHGLNFLHAPASNQGGNKQDARRREKDNKMIAHFEALQALTKDTQKRQTVSEMYSYAEGILNDPQASEINRHGAVQFIRELDLKYPDKKHEIRVGNEVIIDLKSVKSRAPAALPSVIN